MMATLVSSTTAHTTTAATSRALLQALGRAAAALGEQLRRHGDRGLLVPLDAFAAADAWLPAAVAAALRHDAGLLAAAGDGSSGGVARGAVAEALLTPAQLDAGLATLRAINARVAALAALAHEPTSCVTTDRVRVAAAATPLVAAGGLQHQQQHHQQRQWRFAYELSVSMIADDDVAAAATGGGSDGSSGDDVGPLQLVARHWLVRDLSGAWTLRASGGLGGLQPVIAPGGPPFVFRSCVTLPSARGGCAGELVFRAARSRRLVLAPIAPFALRTTPPTTTMTAADA